MKHFVCQWKNVEALLRKNLSHLSFKIGPLPKAPKVVDMQKAASREVFAQSGRFLIAQIHTSRLDDVYIWKLEQVGIHDLDDIGMRVNRQPSQTMDASHEFAIGA